MTETTWSEYVAQVKTWKRGLRNVHELARLEYYANALDMDQTTAQAAVGWALVLHNEQNASLHKPNSDGSQPRQPCRVKHVGRRTYRKARKPVRWDRGTPTERLARAFRDTRINRERREDIALDGAERAQYADATNQPEGN